MAAPDFGPDALARAAGVDPWALARKITTSDPEQLSSTAAGYAAKADEALSVARAGRDADRAAAEAFTNDGAPVYDAEESARSARTLLSDDGEGLRRTGAVFAALATDLVEARSTTSRVLNALAADVDDVVARRNRAVTAPGLTSAAVEEIDRECLAQAAGKVREAGHRIQGALDSYDGQVRRHTATLAAMPQAGPVAVNTTPNAAAPGPLEPAGAVLGQVVDAGASLLNAMANHPGELVALAGGAGLVALGATGELAGLAVDATGVGLPAGLALGGVSTAGVLAGAAAFTAAGGAIVSAAMGEDKVTGVVANPFGDVMTAPTMRDGNGQAWDRNGKWEEVAGAVPDGTGIAHDGSSRAHIPYGSELPDGTWSGGHWRESGVPDATVFPPDWTPERILQQTLDVARNPDQAPRQTDRGTWEVIGTRDDVEILVILKPDGGVVTGHPVRGPGVERNDEIGDPQPLPEN